MTKSVHPTNPDGDRRAITIDALYAAAHPTLYLVDIRPTAERYSAIGFIPGSRSAPSEQIEADIEAFLARFEEDSTIVLLCASGRRSAVLAEKIAPVARQRIATLQGGTIGWGAFGLPLCGTRTPPPENIPNISLIDKLPRALVACFTAESIENTLDGLEASEPAAIVQSIVNEHCAKGLTLASLESALEHLGEVARRSGFRLSRVQENMDAFRAVIARLAATTPRAPSR